MYTYVSLIWTEVLLVNVCNPSPTIDWVKEVIEVPLSFRSIVSGSLNVSGKPLTSDARSSGIKVKSRLNSSDQVLVVSSIENVFPSKGATTFLDHTK